MADSTVPGITFGLLSDFQIYVQYQSEAFTDSFEISWLRTNGGWMPSINALGSSLRVIGSFPMLMYVFGVYESPTMSQVLSAYAVIGTRRDLTRVKVTPVTAHADFEGNFELSPLEDDVPALRDQQNAPPNASKTLIPYRNATMEVFKPDAGSYEQPCRVRLREDQLRLEYEDTGGAYAYSGRAISPGHFELKGEGFDGRATLHTFAGSVVLEGAWREEGSYGMWRIQLGEEAGAESAINQEYGIAPLPERRNVN